MSSDFEKFVRKNRQDFDEDIPSSTVWKNIEKSLPGKRNKHFTLRDIYMWSAAAAVFFVILTSVYFLFIKEYSHETPTVKTGNQNQPPVLDNLSSINPEYAAEFKQASLEVQKRQKQLKAAISNIPELYQKFQEDLNTLDSSYRLLKEKANQSINQDVIIKAMIQNLQLQSELLNRQLMIIHDFNLSKNTKNEKDL